MQRTILGLAGFFDTGKTTLAAELERKYGFVSLEGSQLIRERSPDPCSRCPTPHIINT